MSILSLIQNASNELGLPSVSSVIGNSDTTVVQLLSLAQEVGSSLISQYAWPQLSKTYTFTLATGTAAYALPADFNRSLFRTMWDRTSKWELVGPLTPEEWEAYKSGLYTNTFPRKRFRLMGYGTAQFNIDPTPTSSDNGLTIAYEYQSSTWILPVVWTASTSFAAGAYCSYNGNIYRTTSGGTTGPTAPTHTSSSASDGGVAWTYVSVPYNTFIADTDTTIIDERIIKLGVKNLFLEQKGFDLGSSKEQFDAAVRREMFHFGGAPNLDLSGNRANPLLSVLNTPDTGYGQ